MSKVSKTWRIVGGTILLVSAAIFFVISIANQNTINRRYPRPTGQPGSLEARVALGRASSAADDLHESSVVPFQVLALSMLVPGLLIFGYLVKEKHEKMQVSIDLARDEQVKSLITLIEQHSEVLLQKRRISISVDEYGYQKMDKWDAEKRHFIEHVVKKEITGQLQCSSGSLMKTIDQVLDRATIATDNQPHTDS